MIISHQIEISISELPDEVVGRIQSDLTITNPEYAAAIKRGRSTWNIPDKIKLYRFEGENFILPRGYGSKLVQLLRRHDVEYQLVDERLLLPRVQFRSTIQLRDYQTEAVDALVRHRQGGVVAGCGAGKTMILLEAAARIQQPTLWVTHTHELANQVIERATQVLDLSREEIGFIGGGQATVGKRFTVALAQTLAKIDLDVIKDKFGALLVDEAHHLAARTFFHPIGQFPAMYRLWASATPDRADGMTEMVFVGGGPIVCTVDSRQVPTITPQLLVVETGYDKCYDDYARLMSDLVQNEKRNRLVVQTIAEHAPGHYSLVLSDRVEHLEILRNMLDESLPALRAEILTGNMSKKARADVMERVQRREVDILLATQLAREGLDIKHLDRLFLVTPKRAAAAVQQEVGRVMRPEQGKADAMVIDFWDSGSPILKPQFWRRREVFEKLGMRWDGKRTVESCTKEAR